VDTCVHFLSSSLATERLDKALGGGRLNEVAEQTDLMDVVFAALQGNAKFFANLIDVASERVCRVWMHGFDMRLREGDPIPEGYRLARTVMETGQACSGVVTLDQSAVGVAYRGSAVPIQSDDGVLTHVLGIYQPYALDEMKKDTKRLQGNLDEMAMAGEAFAQSAVGGAERAERLMEQVSKLVERNERLQSLIQFLRDSAGELELLGLNSAIEAARLGAQGAPFRVIAERMRSFAKNAKSESRQVEDDLASMALALGALQNVSESLAAEAEERAASSEQLAAAVREMVEIATHIQDTAERLL
jgi:hypothetical protein